VIPRTPNRAPTVSVVICASTQKSWNDLQDSVESARAQDDASEVVVVIDHEPGMFRRAVERWPGVLVIENAEERGLSGARNTGVLEASGDIVAFLGDDATADADWLTWLLDSFADPHVAGVGGHAEPLWADAKGRALYPDELLWLVGCSYRGLPAEHADVRNVIGCSMAFRRSVLLAVGGFSSPVVLGGRAISGGGEADLSIRIRQADPAARICYEPLSLVHHRVAPDRSTWRHLGRRSFAAGVSKAALSRSLGRTDSLASESSYLTRVLPGAFLRELHDVRNGGGVRALALVVTVAATVTGYALGTLFGAKVSDTVRVPRRLSTLAMAQ
jgi:GT2 family glycosyltransferase